MININSFLYQELSQKASITSRIKQISPVVANDKNGYPALIYSRIWEHRTGIARVGLYQVSIWSEELREAEEIMDEVVKLLSGLKKPPVKHISLVSIDQTYYGEKRMHGIHATLRVKLVDENF